MQDTHHSRIHRQILLTGLMSDLLCTAQGSIILACGLALALLVPGAHAGDSPKNYKPGDFAGPVYEIKEGYAIVEAEKLTLSSKWKKRTDAPGDNGGGCGARVTESYTGSGYMRWEGSALYCKAQGKPEGGNHADITQGCQGSKADWMVAKLWATEPGTYTMLARTYHLERDGDNDWWAGYIGMTGTISRNANCHVRNYSWPDFNNTLPVKLVKGLNAVFIAGRSKGIGIDRIAIFIANKTKALDPKTPESPLYQGSTTSLETAVATADAPSRLALAGRRLRFDAAAGWKGEASLILTDAAGRPQLSTTGQGTVSLDLQGLPAGLYLARLTSGGRNWSRPIVLP